MVRGICLMVVCALFMGCEDTAECEKAVKNLKALQNTDTVASDEAFDPVLEVALKNQTKDAAVCRTMNALADAVRVARTDTEREELAEKDAEAAAEMAQLKDNEELTEDAVEGCRDGCGERYEPQLNRCIEFRCSCQVGKEVTKTDFRDRVVGAGLQYTCARESQNACVKACDEVNKAYRACHKGCGWTPSELEAGQRRLEKRKNRRGR